MNLAYIPSPGFSKFSIGPVTIHMYAICILTGIIFAVWILTVRWKKNGGTCDQVLDTTLVAVPCGLVGARLYHCITTPDIYFPPTGNLSNILKVWEGGMAIFGGIGVGALAAFLWCRHRRYPFALLADCIAPALMVAQAIGRLGNWFNQELYGMPTTLPWGLKLNDADAIGKSEICYNGQACPTGTLFHPTFLYESVWNAVGFVLLHVLSKHRKYDGEIALGYVAWYGLGRCLIEGLRMDSLYWGPFRVSQVLAAVSCIAATAVLLVQHFRPHDPAKLAVNRLAAAEKAKAEAAAAPEENPEQP